MSNKERPLSPHLQIYKPQITSVLSILHRMTGVFLILGTFIFTWWLYALSDGPDYYAKFLSYMSSWIGLLLLFGWTFSLCYHLFNGIRHLFWDIGLGFEMENVKKSGWAVVILTTISTVTIFCMGYSLT